MRLATALAVAALLVLAAPADAQDSVPVVGGGSFNAAPILKPGRYHDTILPAEYLYYGFRLEAGQSLHINLNLDVENSVVRDLDVIYVSGNIHSPTRAVELLGGAADDNQWLGLGEGDTKPMVVTSAVASAEEDRATQGPWKGAGVYYFALHAVYNGPASPPRAEIPFTFQAEVQGTAQPLATPTATPTPARTPVATAAPPRAEASAGPGPAVAAGAGLGGLLIGVIGGIARRQRRR
jgi:hypothetical protein